MRTANIDGAHVEYFRGIANPIGVKVGASMSAEWLQELIQVLNPQNQPGRLTFIHRFGVKDIEQRLPAMIEAVRATGSQVLWVCDPMHGNTETTAGGIKTRRFDNILGEVEAAFRIHSEEGSMLGGVHIELTGEDVTECIGGARGLTEADLARAYKSQVDPRLNAEQALELAMLIARRARRESSDWQDAAAGALRSRVTFAQFVKDPLEGKTSLSRVIWLYGFVGSLVYGSLELFLNPENQFVMRVYTIVGLIFTVYCIVGTYRCAKNTKSPWVARSARIGLFTIQQSEAQEITANLRPNPVFTADAQFLPIFQPNEFTADYINTFAQFDLGISYLFERGKKRQHRLQAAQDAAQTKSTVADNRRTLSFNVASQFFSVQLAESTLDLALQDMKSFQNTVDISEARYKAGDISEADYLKIKLQLLQFQSDVAQAQLAKTQALVGLRQFLGYQSVPEDSTLPAISNISQ